MDAERFERLRSLFHEAAALPVKRREAFLADACGGDAALCSEVLGMLEADAGGDSLLDDGVSGVARGLLEGHGAAFENLRFGPYRLLRLLGEGGMGVVYLAVREDLGSHVAIKFLRDAWLSPARRERFAAEQRTLAQLVHPSIARLYDADTLSDGTPWFAMEYVEGVAITEYLAAHGSIIEERLRLFRAVCEAVQYAHERAVIHRDLKPSNILVKADGSVRLLDFGIAKQLDGGDASADQTRTALRLMTPAYASPEQIRGEPVGIFTDVYALGVTLYQIVSGKLPLDLTGRTATEAERIVVTQEPAPPSSASGGPGLARGAWADLDVLCLTAIHKDVERRYRSVEMLVRDIDHYLKGEPLEARPDTWRYRAAKFVKRNRRAVAASVTGVILLTSMAVFFTVRLAAARNAAVTAAERSQRVQRFMLNLFGGGDKLAAPADGLRVSALVDRGVQEVQTLQRDPELQADLFETLGRISQKLGNLPRAENLLQSALDRRKSLRGAEHPDVAESLVALGLLRVDQARHEDAERLVRQGLDQAGRVRPRDVVAIARATYALGKVLEARGTYDKAIPLLEDAARMQTAAGSSPAELAETWKELADAQFYAGHYQVCEEMTRRAMALHRQVYGERHPLVADDLINLGAVESERGNYQAAESDNRRALEINEAWYGGEHPETASTLSMLGRSLVMQKRFDEAAPMLERSVAIQEHVYGLEHPKVANILNEVASVALQRGRLDEAEPLFQRVVDIYRKAYGDRHYRVALAISNMASVYLKRKEYPRAEAMYRDAVGRYRQAFPGGHAYLAIAEIKLGRVLVLEKRYREAEAYTTSGYRELGKQANPSVTWLQSAKKDLVTIYEALHEPEKATEFR